MSAESSTLFDAQIAPAITKNCTQCGERLPLTAYSAHPNGQYGKQSACKKCHAAYQARRRPQRKAAAAAAPKQPLPKFKRCQRCKQVLAAAKFYVSHEFGQALSRRCRECEREVNAAKDARRVAKTAELVVDPNYRKKCSSCNEKKPAQDFSKCRHSPDGYNYLCRPCANSRWKKKPQTLWDHMLRKLSQMRRRCQVKGIEDVTINVYDVLEMWHRQDGVCPYTGIKMTHQRGEWGKGYFYTNVSIDRIDPSRGYVQGNVQLICYWANLAKSMLSEAEFFSWVNVCASHLRGKATKTD